MIDHLNMHAWSNLNIMSIYILVLGGLTHTDISESSSLTLEAVLRVHNPMEIGRGS